MADPEDCRVFVGGLSWDTNDKRLEQAFRRFGKVLDAKVMVDKDTGRPRGFGFVTFTDEQSVEDAINGLHNGELDGRIISVSKAQPKLMGGRDFGYEDRYEDRYENGGGRGGYSRGGGSGSGGFGGGRGAGATPGSDDCFRCGRSGHWARDCPYGGGDGGRSYSGGDGGRFQSRFSGSSSGGGGGRPDKYGGGTSFGGPRYGGDDRYSSGRERYGSGRYNDSGYGRGGRGGFDRSGDRYGSGGPTRFDRSYRDRPAPYGGRQGGRSSFESRY